MELNHFFLAFNLKPSTKIKLISLNLKIENRRLKMMINMRKMIMFL